METIQRLNRNIERQTPDQTYRERVFGLRYGPAVNALVNLARHRHDRESGVDALVRLANLGITLDRKVFGPHGEQLKRHARPGETAADTLARIVAEVLDKESKAASGNGRILHEVIRA
ncbi:MAG: hypothetical protein KGH69_04475 [Candidatus Micrarchaeota archaeon]|nr:hypothetical protein [Candidatus Micrarchaeota archaeon]